MNKTPTFSGEVVKRILWLALAMAVALLASTGPAAATDGNLTQEYSTCLNQSNGVTAEMTNCILAETARQDAKLNERYKKLISKLSKQRQTALIEAQRAWIRFRDANCGFYDDPEGGSAARLIANECFLKAIVDRAEELKLLTSDE
jgi:uncharacterized protein YecT (DUF1311 family)